MATNRQSPVPIAGGEHAYLASGFQQLIYRRLHAVLQPDINWCGGAKSQTYSCSTAIVVKAAKEAQPEK